MKKPKNTVVALTLKEAKTLAKNIKRLAKGENDVTFTIDQSGASGIGISTALIAKMDSGQVITVDCTDYSTW